MVIVISERSRLLIVKLRLYLQSRAICVSNTGYSEQFGVELNTFHVIDLGCYFQVNVTTKHLQQASVRSNQKTFLRILIVVEDYSGPLE